jgi:hypothetical protein
MQRTSVESSITIENSRWKIEDFSRVKHPPEWELYDKLDEVFSVNCGAILVNQWYRELGLAARSSTKHVLLQSNQV